MDGLASLAKIFTHSAPTAASTGSSPLWQKLLVGGLLGGGEVGNILESVKQAKLQNQMGDYVKYVLGLTKNPAQISKLATAEAAPLSQALTQTVTNQVQGDMAERGLSQAPGIFAGSESQALAPFVQQNYNTALQAVLSQLGIPMQAMQVEGGSFKPAANLSPLLSQFLKLFPSKTTAATPGLTLPTGDAGLNFPFPTGDTGANA